MEKKQLVKVETPVPLRADKFLGEKLEGFSRSALVRVFEQGLVSLNGRPISKSTQVKQEDELEVILPELKELEAVPQNIELEIVFEDDDVVVVNKQKGMVVHPANGHEDKTLVNALLYHCRGRLSEINGVIRPGIVHRIDKDTSGLLMVAKNNKAHIALANQIKAHSFLREYEAVVYGNFKEKKGTISLPIGRSSKDRKKMAVTYKNAKPGVTHFEVLREFDGFSHLKLRLETGRTHQIRVHMAYVSHPVAGDLLYGPKKVIKELGGQCLHAKSLGFVHPRTGEYMQFEAQLPEYFKQFLARLEGKTLS